MEGLENQGSNGNGAHPPEVPEITTAFQLVRTVEPPTEVETKLLETDWPENDGLSKTERIVLLAYIETRNITEAGRRAGLKLPYDYAKRILENDRVQKVLKGRLRANHITIDHVLGELSDLAYADMGDFIHENGTPNIRAIKRKGKFVKTFQCKLTKTTSEEGVTEQVYDVKIELHDRHAALVDVGKTFRMFGNESQAAGEGGQTAQMIINLVVLAAEQELPKELAGRLLIALGEKMKTVKG